LLRGLPRVSVVRELVQAQPLRAQMAQQGGHRGRALPALVPLQPVVLRVELAWADRAREDQAREDQAREVREGLQVVIFRRCCRGFQLSRFLI
jgi:hypothetical protein